MAAATEPSALSDPPISDGPYARLDFQSIERIDTALKALAAAERAVPVAQAGPDFRTYRAQLFLLAGSLLVAVLLILVLVYQFRLIRRSWNIAVRAVRGRRHDRAGVGPFVLVLLPFATFALALPVFVDLAWTEPAARPGWDALFPLVAVALTAGLIGMVGVFHGLATLGRPAAGNGRLHWPDLLYETTPAWVAGLCAAVAAPLAILAGHGLALPNALDAGVLGSGAAGTWLAVATGVVLATLIGATYFGTRVAARGFPDLEAVERFLDGTDLEPESDFRRAPDLWRDMLKLHRERPEAGRTPPAVFPSSEPAHARALIQAMTRTLLLAMIATLVIVSLALDWLVVRAEPNAALEADLRIAVETWLYVIGAGFSLALGIVYLGPSVRLDPYLDAYGEARELMEKDPAAGAEPAAAKPPLREWSGAVTVARRGQYRLSLREGPEDHASSAPVEAKAFDLDPPKDAAPSAEEQALARRLGADALKFAAILRVVSYGAAFHSLLELGLRARVVQALTLIAPAAASVFLNLLK
jgi:hypothetical protein